jgi:Putative regulator of cell autolysis
MKLKDILGTELPAEMTAEALAELLETDYSVLSQEEVDSQLAIAKDKYDKSISKMNADKKQKESEVTEKTTELDIIKADLEVIKAEREEAKQELEIANKTKDFMKHGFSEENASKMASSLVKDGDVSAVFEGLEAYKATVVEATKAELLESAKGTPPNGGGGKQTTTKEEFAQMGYTEKLVLKNDNPQLYEELIK